MLTRPAERRAGRSGAWASSGGFPCPLALVPQPWHHGSSLYPGSTSTGPSGHGVFRSGSRSLGLEIPAGRGRAPGKAGGEGEHRVLPHREMDAMGRGWQGGGQRRVVLVQRGGLRHRRGHGHPHLAKSRAAFASLHLHGAVPRPVDASHTTSDLAGVAANPRGLRGELPPRAPSPAGPHRPHPSGHGGAQLGCAQRSGVSSVPPQASPFLLGAPLPAGGCLGPFGALPRGWLPLLTSKMRGRLQGKCSSPTGSALRS